jgi:hypothetical protein
VQSIDLASGAVYHHLPLHADEFPFADQLRACVDAQTAAAAERRPGTSEEEAAEQTSPEALERAIAAGDSSDIRTDNSLTNCLVFHTTGLPGSVIDEDVNALRQEIDALVNRFVRETTTGLAEPAAIVSGHFWYPRGSFMGWHTNSRVPGWRMYLTYAEEPGRSYFRYRDPSTGKIVTSLDTGWDLRMFEVEPARAFWHSVYSGTNRFSFGYRLSSGATEENTADAAAARQR